MTRSTTGSSAPGRPRPVRRLLPLLLAAVLGLVVPSLPAAAEPSISTGVAFTIGDPRITESSGLAADSDNNVFWTVNDSGDRGVVYAIGPEGRTRGTVEFAGDPLDVEALAYANQRLYIADIGDNQLNRQSVRVFVINSPVPGTQRGEDVTVYEFTYPDGPHDAEAILVDRNGQLRIVTKDAKGGVYRAPRTLRAGTPNPLSRVADAPAFVTDATVLPSGRFAMRTYLAVEVVEPDLYAPVTRAPLPFQRQGESMTVSLSGNALLVGSEGPQSQVLRVPIPMELRPAPGGVASPPPSPSPTPAPTPSAEALPAGAGTNRSGTFVALGLALLVSIAAGAVVFLRDRTPAPTPAAPGSARRRWSDDEAAGADWGADPSRSHAAPRGATRAADPVVADDAAADPGAAEAGQQTVLRPAAPRRTPEAPEPRPTREPMPWETSLRGQRWAGGTEPFEDDDPTEIRPR